MNKEEVIPCVFYFYIHCKLKEKYKEAAVLSTKEAMNFLFEWRIPKEIRPIIIKELEILNLIKKINKKTIEIRNSTFNLEDLREFYRATKIY